MKPAPFRYLAARTVDDAIAALAEHAGAKLLAGGQSLVPLMNFRLARPGWLIDINRIPELKGIRLAGDRVMVGSMTRHAELERSDLVTLHVPLISEAVPLIGHAPIRVRGTIGGSVCHADPAANLPIALLALDAVMHARGPRGPRTIAAEDFFVSMLTTALAPDEVLTAVEVPIARSSEGSAYVEFARRRGDFALAAAAVRLRIAAGRIEAGARIAIGAATDHVTRPARAEALLSGAEPAPALLESVAAEAAREIAPMADIHGSADYRRELVRGLVRDALGKAVTRATGEPVGGRLAGTR